MTSRPLPIPVERIEKAILLVRGQKVMLDRDLAVLYGVETRPYDGKHCIPVS
ncbi:MAG: hypothetical protein H6Q41_2437 [Deltaproteobacteria bacterium]|jgi:hypothetical protein|nr:hypothetical protein [Deltaproteobacteria bacterium]